MNKYEKIFGKEDGNIDPDYELKKANYVIANLIEQRNIVLNELAMIRAEATMLSEELKVYKEEKEKENKEEDTNEE
jgi:hypothetical protein|tara:strand:- start:1203 stop:1430 length:228 start_codon:yes stop_codon:yes gene_type:complete